MAPALPSSPVIAGLDPAIQRFASVLDKALDARVKPAHDERKEKRASRRWAAGR
jgi:hypothetical protein